MTRLFAHTAWRPDWAAERPRYWWYLTFETRGPLAEEAQRLQHRLRHVDAAQLLPLRWLHLTVQDIGFVDELAEAEIQRLVEHATATLQGLPALRLWLGPLTTMGSAVVLAAEPVEHLAAMRCRLRQAMSTTRVPPSVPGPVVFRPHVSLAYLDRECHAAEVLGPVDDVRHTSVPITVPTVTLVKVTRGHCSYRWTTCAELPLGREARRGERTAGGRVR